MNPPCLSLSWESYYVIIGSSGAALTGLNFVVIALSAETRVLTPTPGLINTYETPTIGHFCAVLLVSALLSAPWHTVGPVRLGFGASGLAGILYSLVILRRVTTQEGYRPELEDWIWRGIFPPTA